MSRPTNWGFPRTSADGTITGGKLDPEQAAERIDDSLDALLSSHADSTGPSSRPTYAVLGTVWIDIDTNQLFLYDGSSTDWQVAVNVGAPASASDTGTAGDVAWDTDYLYICTATDTWKRVAVATW